MTTLTIERTQSRSFSFKEWMGLKNVLFSALAEETITNKDVMLALQLVLSFFSVLTIGTSSFIGAALSLAWFGFAVGMLNINTCRHDAEA